MREKLRESNVESDGGKRYSRFIAWFLFSSGEMFKAFLAPLHYFCRPGKYVPTIIATSQSPPHFPTRYFRILPRSSSFSDLFAFFSIDCLILFLRLTRFELEDRQLGLTVTTCLYKQRLCSARCLRGRWFC